MIIGTGTVFGNSESYPLWLQYQRFLMKIYTYSQEVLCRSLPMAATITAFLMRTKRRLKMWSDSDFATGLKQVPGIGTGTKTGVGLWEREGGGWCGAGWGGDILLFNVLSFSGWLFSRLFKKWLELEFIINNFVFTGTGSCLKGPWHEIFNLVFCDYFSSGALICSGNSILQLNSNLRQKSKSKSHPRGTDINTARMCFRFGEKKKTSTKNRGRKSLVRVTLTCFSCYYSMPINTNFFIRRTEQTEVFWPVRSLLCFWPQPAQGQIKIRLCVPRTSQSSSVDSSWLRWATLQVG